MSIVVHELAAMPVAASGYEVGPLAPADGRSVERRALLIRCHLINVGKGLIKAKQNIYECHPLSLSLPLTK